MTALRSLPLLLILFTILAITASSSPTEQRPRGDPDQFQALLSTVADSELHDVLCNFDNRFKDGVFHRDRTAMEAVHSEDPAMATELIKLAKQKRQLSNTTMTNGPITTSDAGNTPTSTNGGSIPQTTTTSTTDSEIRTSVIPPSSPTGASVVSTTSGAVIYSETNGVLTTAHSATALVSFRPSTTTLLITTTLPGGQASTMTSVAVVDAAYTTLSTDTAVAAQSGTSTGQPSLQTGAASSRGPVNGMMGALAGLAAVALAI